MLLFSFVDDIAGLIGGTGPCPDAGVVGAQVGEKIMEGVDLKPALASGKQQTKGDTFQLLPKTLPKRPTTKTTTQKDRTTTTQTEQTTEKQLKTTKKQSAPTTTTRQKTTTEPERVVEPVKCEHATKLDVMIIVDVSGSIEQVYGANKKLLMEVLDALPLGVYYRSTFCVVMF